MPDLYGIVAVCSRPGKDGLYAVCSALQSRYDREDAERHCTRLNSESMPPCVLRYEVVEAEEWDRLAVQQALVGGNALPLV